MGYSEKGTKVNTSAPNTSWVALHKELDLYKPRFPHVKINFLGPLSPIEIYGKTLIQSHDSINVFLPSYLHL